MKKIYIIIGTRPEIIKMSPVIPSLESKFNVKVIYTGQHYSEILSMKIFSDLNLKKPVHYFNSKNDSSAKQFPNMIGKIVDVLESDRPNAVVVHGDTNTTLAGALAANKLEIPVIHIESGARSGNKNEPEEINRMLVDQIAYINFPFSDESVKCLKKENIIKNSFNLPNTAREAVERNIQIAENTSDILKKLELKSNDYVISTLHRATNTNNLKNLKKYLYTVSQIGKITKVVISLHPRTQTIITENNLKIPTNVIIIPPVGYLDFLLLLKNAQFALSDSGGIVDESLVLNIPLFIFRNETERDDVIKLKKAILLKPELTNIQIKDFIGKNCTNIKISKIRSLNVNFKVKSSKEMVRIISKLIK
jgi:UDP-N-acetylglucosamine 2-epimerase